MVWEGSSGSVRRSTPTSSPSSSQAPSTAASSTSLTGSRSTIPRWSCASRSSSTCRSRSAPSRRAFSLAWRSEPERRARSLSNSLRLRSPSVSTRPIPRSRPSSSLWNGSSGRASHDQVQGSLVFERHRYRLALPHARHRERLPAPVGHRHQRLRRDAAPSGEPDRGDHSPATHERHGLGVEHLRDALDSSPRRRPFIVEAGDQRQELRQLLGRPARGRRRGRAGSDALWSLGPSPSGSARTHQLTTATTTGSSHPPVRAAPGTGSSAVGCGRVYRSDAGGIS